MVNNTQLTATPCPKIDPLDINAYFNLGLDPIDTGLLKLETSWGCTSVDLTGVLNGNETITHLFLSPADNPTALQYNREDYGKEGAPNGGVDCIEGDALSRIISMRYLKDVSQTEPIEDGYVYMWNNNIQLFVPFNLQDFVTQTNNTLNLHTSQITTLQSTVQAIQQEITSLRNRLTNVENRVTQVEADITALQNRMTALEQMVTALGNRISAIENAIYNWSADKSTPITRGNINVYGDNTNTNSHSSGIFSHSPNSNVTNDLYFA